MRTMREFLSRQKGSCELPAGLSDLSRARVPTSFRSPRDLGRIARDAADT